MAFVRIVRTSAVKTTRSSHNQCKEVGHEEYEYTVRITVPENNLDAAGFILDHYYIHEKAKQLFKEPMGSCEQLCVRLGHKLLRMCKKRGVNVVDMYVRVQPLGPALAYIDWSLSGDF